MANALIYCPSGGGKTVNATAVTAGQKGKNLLICTDNSSVVLRNFARKGLTVKNVRAAEELLREFDAATAGGEYDNVILDNISDFFDMWITELRASERFKDVRQAYQLVYQKLKMITRQSGMKDCNVIFTAWSDNTEVVTASGERSYRISPKLPGKILDNICGLVNIVAYINTAEKDGVKRWYYLLDGTPQLYAKDQLYCRKSCLPEDLFTAPKQDKEEK